MHVYVMVVMVVHVCDVMVVVHHCVLEQLKLALFQVVCSIARTYKTCFADRISCAIDCIGAPWYLNAVV